MDRGRQDVSFWKAIRKADAAFAVGSRKRAIEGYRYAIELAAVHPVGHHRLGAALAIEGEVDDAIAALSSALRFSSKPLQRAQILFLQATIADNSGDLQVAKVRWRAYLDQINNAQTRAGSTSGSTHQRSAAEERLKRIQLRERQLIDYGVVRKHIQSRERELGVQAR